MLKKGDRVYLLRRNITIVRLSDKLDYRKLGLFEITEVKGLVNFKLKLPKSINIYPMFYILLLKLVLPGTPKALQTKI